MPYPLPPTLSPSRVSAFTDCALAYRFANLDRLPEPPSPHATKGTLVHSALEELFARPGPERTPEAGADALDAAATTLRLSGVYEELGLDEEGSASFVADAHRLLGQYFAMEDPRDIEAIGLELKLRAEIGGVSVTGIIDRLDRTAEGDLVVVDYKTGRAPPERFEQGKMLGVDTYAVLCEKVLGQRPVEVRLLYLADAVSISCRPSERGGRFVEQKVGAVWQTIQRANAADAFKPKPGKLCDWCSFQTWCPAYGGDPEEARRVGEELRAARREARSRGPAASGADGTLAERGDPLPFPGHALLAHATTATG